MPKISSLRFFGLAKPNPSCIQRERYSRSCGAKRERKDKLPPLEAVVPENEIRHRCCLFALGARDSDLKVVLVARGLLIQLLAQYIKDSSRFSPFIAGTSSVLNIIRGLDLRR